MTLSKRFEAALLCTLLAGAARAGEPSAAASATTRTLAVTLRY
jgi:hypothetical protein